MSNINDECRTCPDLRRCGEGENCCVKEFERSEAKRVRDNFENGEMYIAKGCVYPLNSRLNNNVMVVGGTGTGKTTSILERNLQKFYGSMLFSDPKGVLHKKYRKKLEKAGYDVKYIDFSHPEKGLRFNPLVNIKNTQDIIRLANILVQEKRSAGTKADPYWDSMTFILLSSLIAYMIETKYEPFTFAGILALMREGTRKDEDDKSSKLSERFADHKKKYPGSWACSQFENVDAAPYKTYDTIRTTLAAKFAKFDTNELRQMMSGNDTDFTQIGRRKTAVFVTVSDTDRSMDDLANIFFSQAMHVLCDFADNECEDFRLPIPVRFILDDFATNCRIEEFPRIISAIRSRGISVMLLIQAESQLAQYYGCDDTTIIANCDTYVYLGGNDIDTAESISRRCNKPLSQVLYMPAGSCWVFRRGEQPVYTKLLERPDQLKEQDI